MYLEFECELILCEVTHVLFETGSEELKAIEGKIFVASGRFVLEEGKPLVVQYKISEVAAS